MKGSENLIETKVEDWGNLKLRGPSSAEELSRRDESHLSRLGKKRECARFRQAELSTDSFAEVLKRRFGMVSMLGLSTTLMLTWEGILVYV